MSKGLWLSFVLASIILNIAMVIVIGGSSYVSAQGQFEPQVNELLTNFIDCWDRAIEVSIANMSSTERYYCRNLMDNSFEALNHIYNAGTLSTYSQETQDLAYRVEGIMAPYKEPNAPCCGPGPSTNTTVQSTMPGNVSDSFLEHFFIYLGGSSGANMTYGECNYIHHTCTGTDPITGEVTDVPWTAIPEEEITMEEDTIEYCSAPLYENCHDPEWEEKSPPWSFIPEDEITMEEDTLGGRP